MTSGDTAAVRTELLQELLQLLLVLAKLVLIALGLILQATKPKLHQVRTVTARNQPVGHQEPDWVYDQKTNTGVYAELTDSQLRALNIEPSRVSHLRVEPGTNNATPVSSGKHTL